jgi:hypothetical protein
MYIVCSCGFQRPAYSPEFRLEFPRRKAGGGGGGWGGLARISPNRIFHCKSENINKNYPNFVTSFSTGKQQKYNISEYKIKYSN